jgi:hypothetical protein
MTILTKGTLSSNNFGIIQPNYRPVDRLAVKNKPLTPQVKTRMGLDFNQRQGISIEEFSKRYKTRKIDEPKSSRRDNLGKWSNFLNAGYKTAGCSSCGGYK